MKKRSILALLLLAALVLSQFNVWAEGTGMDIRARLGDPDINLLDTFDITFFDDNGDPTDTPDINAKVEVTITWHLDHTTYNTDEMEDGDYYTFTLPETFKIGSPMTGTLSEFGTFVIDTDRTVTFIFNSEVPGHSAVEGTLEFEARLDDSFIDEAGPQVITLPIKEEAEFFFTVVPTNVDNSVDKDGNFDRQLNPTQIVWDITFNKNYSSLTGVAVNDTLPAGLALESIKVYTIDLNHDGTVAGKNTDLVLNVDYTTNGTTVSFLNPVSMPTVVEYTTTILDDYIPADGGTVDFYNQATVTSDQTESLPTNATLVASYGKLLDKKAPVYNGSTQTFEWVIEYNYGEKTINNPVLIDTFDSRLEYVAGSLRFVDSSGNDVTFDHTVTQLQDNQLQIQIIETIDSAYKIVYKTRVRQGVLITGATTFVNEVSSGGETDGSSGTAQPQLIDKGSNSIDYNARTIGWTVTVNKNQYELNDYIFTDTYSFRGLTLLTDTFQVHDISGGANALIDASKYTLTITYDAGEESGFTLTFNDGSGYEQTTSTLRISYQTYYDVNQLTTDAKNAFMNHIRLDWTDTNGDSHHHDDDASRSIIAEAINNGKKAGSYNAVDKTITWTVNLNYNGEDISNPIMVDKILGNQNYVDGSLEIYAYTVDSGWQGGTSIDTSIEVNLDDFDITLPSADNDYTLTIVLPTSGTTKYQVTYKTSLENEVIGTQYFNTAVFTNDGRIRNLIASVSVKNGGKFVAKTGVQGTGEEGSLIKWTITINASQSTIEDAVIVDNPSSNQILLEDTFNLYPVSVAADESFTVDRANPLVRGVDYDLSITTDDQGNQTFELSFVNTISRTYVLEYDSQISTEENNPNITNTVSLQGNSITYSDSGGQASVVIDILRAGGSAVGVKGSLTVLKTDEDGNPLQGVYFELYNRLSQKIREGYTDIDGKIVFANLVYGNYTLKETEALPGYVISDDLYLGAPIVVDAASSQPDAYTQLFNSKNTTTITKLSEGGELLDGAIFKLEAITDSGTTQLYDNLTSEAGVFVIEGLAAGNYRLTEISAPDGYILNQAAYDFTINVNANNQAENAEFSFVNYQGSVELTKIGEDSTVLAGVRFNIIDENGTVIHENLETNGSGLITVDHLAPGNYAFVEVGSAEGHIINTTPIPFTVVSAYSGQPDTIRITAANGKGTVQLVKTDDNDEPLVGVQFTLLKLEGEEWVDYGTRYSGDEGKIVFTQLQPGSYALAELTTLPGYILNSEKVYFEVPVAATTHDFVVTLDNYINYQGRIIIEKIDEQGELVEEATFSLTNHDNNAFLGYFVTEGGVINLNGLAPGTYIIKETLAPSGFILDENEYEIIIPEIHEGQYDGELLQVVNVRNVLDANLPETGRSSLANGLALLFILLGGATLLAKPVLAQKKRED